MSILAQQTERKVLLQLAQCLTYLNALSTLKMTAEDAFDIRQAENAFRRIIEGNEFNYAEIYTMNSISVTKNDTYVLVRWPEVHDLMAYEWFYEECMPYQASSDQNNLDSSYFVPLRRIIGIEIEINQPG